MKYDFETLINRRNKGSNKWMGMKDIKPDVKDDVVPLSVADVDMKLAPEIQEGLIAFMKDNPVLGYTGGTDEYYQSVIDWMKEKHNYHIEKDWIVLSNGVVPALNNSVEAYSHEGDGVIIFTPVYYPFSNAINSTHRTLVRCPLINKDNHYVIDFDLFESLAKDPKNKLVIFCNPHNPVGRVWTQEELTRVGEICLKNDMVIVSDEIHQDLIMPGHQHFVMANVSQEVENITITCTAPSKSFNIAGLQGSNIIIKNQELREKFAIQQNKVGFFTLNALSFEATRLAYRQGNQWLEEFKNLIYTNYKMLVDYVEANLPGVKVLSLEGTYLAWLDLRELGYSYQELEKRMIDNDLFLDEGYVFGQEGEGFERFNIACPSHILKDALDRFKKAIQ